MRKQSDKQSRPLRWISSEGGPLILIDRAHLGFWEGDKDVWDGEPSSSGEATTFDDYDRACQVNEYVGLIPVGMGEGLILGDEPLPTTWYPSTGMIGGHIIRGGLAYDENELLRQILNIPDEKYKEEGIVFSSVSGSLLLFDSGCPGREPDCLETGCLIQFELAVGSYIVRTVNHTLEDGGWTLVHSLINPSC
jgi:hypothetical protein